ncbi:MAG: cytidylate kinase-like family protein [Rhodobacterales bacterium]|nr:cytidylate kinase-like family protein [Rhodobacterales bacterium]
MDAQSVIRALTKVSESTPAELSARSHPPVVTLSRSMGSGGDEIAAALSERLGVPCYAREILDKVAAKARVNTSLVNKLHERISHASDSWLYSLVAGKNMTRDDYLYHLVATVRGLYQMGGIIVGRGSNIILAGRDALRVRITGSVEICAARVAAQDGTELVDAVERVKASNKKRNAFTQAMFKEEINDPRYYDLVVNTDRFTHMDDVVELILRTMVSLKLVDVERAFPPTLK